ncbi:MAG: ABC transporter ATP-binding protein [Nanoarchaeota archaeon]|jgi:putative ABC transport system ATP-binding protein|nr:ABC transporter ATP-binding protein [Nanoarchaeota archaeon]
MKKGEVEPHVIELKNVCKYYYMGENVVKAVDDLSLTIEKGSFIAIMGPSGSGKSTAMNLVGSLDVPTSGTVYLDGEDISFLTESDLAQIRGKKIGFIFQSFNLIPNLTTRENVALPMTFQGYDEFERAAKAEELLKLVDLADRGDHYPGELSGGQRQRVAIARSLANNPEMILADEPTGNLDTKTGDIVMEFLSKMHKQGKTIVVITHEPELAKKYAEIVYWLKDGKLEKVTQKKNGFTKSSKDKLNKLKYSEMK